MLLRVRPAVGIAFLTAIAVALTSPSPAPAQDKDKDKDKDKELVKQAKDTALANLKKAGLEKPTVVETNNFIIVGSVSAEKAKALGEVLEKTTTLTRKTLKYDEKEASWKGKLTVYFVPDNAEYKSLMRRAFQQPPEGAFADLRAEPPFIVDPAEVTGKATDADLYASTAARVSGEHLKARGTGAQTIPDWLRDGFGRVTAMRAEGTTSKRYVAYKSQAKAALTKGARPPALADIWSDAKSANGEVLATSFAEYLAYGPGASKFQMFLDGLKPSENIAMPTVQQGLDAAGWKEKDLPALDLAWRRWISAGK